MSKSKVRITAVWVTLAILVLSLGLAAVPTAAEDARVHITGNNTWIVGNYGDNFVYDGDGYVPTSGFVNIDINEEANTGIVVATWEAQDYYGESGTFTAIIDEWMGAADWQDGGIATDVYVHGDTGRGPPVLPTMLAYIAGYGVGDVYVNGVLMWEDLDAHFMVTEGTRDPVERAVWNADGTGYFSPMAPSDGKMFPDDVLTHVVLHSEEEDTGNFPAFTEFFHINYENIGKVLITGCNTYIVGDYGDNFVYDGDGYDATSGFVTINVNDLTNTGTVVASWEATDYYGYSGTFTAVINGWQAAADWQDGGIVQGIYAHGDTGRGPPVLPTVYAYLAGYGVGNVYLDGVLMWEDLDAHFMITDGTRDPVMKKVWNADGTDLFSPMSPADGKVFPDTLLTHIVLHSEDEDTGNFPAFTEFLHINYESTSSSMLNTGVLIDQRLAPLQTDLEMAKLRVTDLESDLMEALDSILGLETDLAAADLTIADLQMELADALDMILGLQEDLDLLSEELGELHDEFHDSGEVIEDLTGQLSDLIEEVSDLASDLTAAEQRVSTVEDDLMAEKDRSDNLEGDLRTAENEITKVQKDNDDLKNSASSATNLGWVAAGVAVVALLVAVVAFATRRQDS